MKLEAETLRITASAKMPDGQPYNWTISLPISRILKEKNPSAYVFLQTMALLNEFPNLVEAYLSNQKN